MTETTILDEGAVSEVAREPLSDDQLHVLIRIALAMAQRVIHSRFCDPHPMGQCEACKSTTEAIVQLDALCATIKHLREELSTTKGHWANTSEDLASAWLKNDDLQSQLEQLQTRLAQVEQERNAEIKDHQLTISTFRRQEKIWQQKFDELKSDAIQLCKDKAAEWQLDSNGYNDTDGMSISLIGKAAAARELADEIGKL